MQHLSLSDKDAAVLTEEIATQPEIIRQYDGFKNEAKTLIFDLDEKFSDDMYQMLEDLSTRVQRYVAACSLSWSRRFHVGRVVKQRRTIRNVRQR